MTDKRDSSSHGEGDSIRVMIRVRPPPPDSHEDTCLEVDRSRNAIVMLCKPEQKVFTYDQIAEFDATQDCIFNTVGRRVIESCMSGYNGTIFAYGQTGSGKTYTMLGPSEDSDNFQHQMRGVIPRSFEYLFNLINREIELHGEKVQFLCKCSFLEIYNEQIFDLLDTGSSGLQLREDIKRGVFVDGLIEQTVADAAEAYEVLSSGWLNRTVASTSMNRESSRSHAVFTVVVESKENKNGVWSVRKSFLNLVDLAGSERQKDTQTTGVRLKEAGKINKSLSVLGNVIMALVDIAHGKSRHVPYRDSKLSFLLRDSLGGNAKTQMIACIHSGSRSFGETLSTLLFARRAKMIKNKAVVNEDSHGSVVHLQAEIKRLKETLSQYQQGVLVSEPSDPAVPSEEGDAGDDAWKTRFMQAMYLRSKEETKIQNLGMEVKQLKDLCNSKDKIIQNNKMILKFRDAGLQRMENAHKDKVKLSPDDKDKIIEAHQQERKTWQDNYNNHPDAKSYKIAYERLGNEVKQLRSEESSQTIDKRKANELLKVFEGLLESDDKLKTSGQTPQHQKDNELTERQKAHMEKLETDCDKLNDKLSTLTEKCDKLEAELKAAKASKEQAESLLEAHHMRHQVERENAEERHRDTIKSLTPKKSCVKWQLRNRPVMVPGSGHNTPIKPLNLDESLTENEPEMITDQGVPSEFSEERVQGLIEEMEKISKELLNIRTELDGRDKQILHLVEEKSLVESSKDQLSKNLGDEVSKYDELKITLEAKVASLTSMVSSVKEDARYANEAKEEMELMAKHDDKRLRELTQERDGLSKYISKCSSLETEILKLMTESSNLKKNEELTQERLELIQEELETTQDTLSFQEGQLQDKEVRLNCLTEEIKTIMGKLKISECSLEQSEEKRAELSTQLHQAGDKEKQIAEAMQRADQLESEIRQGEEIIQQLTIQRKEALEKNETLRKELEVAIKADSDKKEYIKCLTDKVANLKCQIQDYERVSSEKQTINEELEVERDALLSKIEERESEFSTELSEKTTEFAEHLTELEKSLLALNQRLEDVNEEKDSHFIELQSVQQMNHEFMESNEVLSTELKRFENKVKDLELDLDASHMAIAALKNARTLELDDAMKNMMSENEELNTRLKDKEARCDKLSTAFDSVSNLQKISADENWRLKVNVSDLEQKCHHQEVKNSDMSMTLNSAQLIEKELLEQMEDVQCRLALAEVESMQANQHEKGYKAAKQEANQLISQLEDALLQLAENELEETRLKQELGKKQESTFHLESSVEQLQKELESSHTKIVALNEEVKRLHIREAELAGHHNHAQKIQYVHTLKDELLIAREKSTKLDIENKNLRVELIKYKNSGTVNKNSTPLKREVGDHHHHTPKQAKTCTMSHNFGDKRDDCSNPGETNSPPETQQTAVCITPLKERNNSNTTPEKVKENVDPSS